ncbi:MAG TPA: thymidine phosphorylase [Alphaproteobacteria bacterium]|nr:thymidine phosphorylase [Alphaproteobacteria bacterium]
MNKMPLLQLKRLGIDTHKEAIIYMREDCHICISEGFKAHTRVKVTLDDRSIIATLNIIKSSLLEKGKAGLSECAWEQLKAEENNEISISHARPVESLSYVRSKIYNNVLSEVQLNEIIKDITTGSYSDIHISSFLTACAGGRLDVQEIASLTKAMVETGNRMNWQKQIVVDKHCVGGLPGNRTTPIVVSIVAAFGLTMPKTSSRAITSPAGTADTMEVFTNVDLSLEMLKRVVNQENACLAWGGAISISPADDMLIQVERALELDSEGQLVASVLSKKISAGSTHVLIDLPVGATSKIRSDKMAELLISYLVAVGNKLGIKVKTITTDGSQPVGNGIGPALEARDVLAVLQNDKQAPSDLRERSLLLAGNVLEFSPDVREGEGYKIAAEILDSGKALKKLIAICKAQGGFREVPEAQYTYPVLAQQSGVVVNIDNRRIAKIAKLTGAPEYKVGGIDLHIRNGSSVNKGDKLYTIHTNSKGMLSYVLDYVKNFNHAIIIDSNNLRAVPRQNFLPF